MRNQLDTNNMLSEKKNATNIHHIHNPPSPVIFSWIQRIARSSV